MTRDQQAPTRRDFLQTSTSLSAAAALGALAIPRSVHAAGTDETLRVGLVGCGGRGAGAAIDALAADPNAKLVALADAFADRAGKLPRPPEGRREFGKQVAVDPDRVYHRLRRLQAADRQRRRRGAARHAAPLPPASISSTPSTRASTASSRSPSPSTPPAYASVMAACDEAKKKSLAIVSGLVLRATTPAMREVEPPSHRRRDDRRHRRHRVQLQHRHALAPRRRAQVEPHGVPDPQLALLHLALGRSHHRAGHPQPRQDRLAPRRRRADLRPRASAAASNAPTPSAATSTTTSPSSTNTPAACSVYFTCRQQDRLRSETSRSASSAPRALLR